MEWQKVTAETLRAHMAVELATASDKWIVAFPQKVGRLEEITNTVRAEFRDVIASVPKNSLNPDPDTLPESVVRHAENIIQYEMGMEMGVKLTADGRRLLTEAEIYRRQIAYGHYKFEDENNPTVTTPTYTVPGKPEGRALGNLVALTIGFFLSLLPCRAAWIQESNEITYVPVNYDITEQSLNGHLTGIDKALGWLSDTNSIYSEFKNLQWKVEAGLQNTVRFQLDQDGDMSAVTIGTRDIDGDYSVTKFGEDSLTVGSKNRATEYCSIAMGAHSYAVDERSFVWNPDNTLDYHYDSHGSSTFNVNPEGGADGFFIGEQPLSDLLAATNNPNHVTLQQALDATGSLSKKREYYGQLGIGFDDFEVKLSYIEGYGSYFSFEEATLQGGGSGFLFTDSDPLAQWRFESLLPVTWNGVALATTNSVADVSSRVAHIESDYLTSDSLQNYATTASVAAVSGRIDAIEADYVVFSDIAGFASTQDVASVERRVEVMERPDTCTLWWTDATMSEGDDTAAYNWFPTNFPTPQMRIVVYATNGVHHLAMPTDFQPDKPIKVQVVVWGATANTTNYLRYGTTTIQTVAGSMSRAYTFVWDVALATWTDVSFNPSVSPYSYSGGQRYTVPPNAPATVEDWLALHPEWATP